MDDKIATLVPNKPDKEIAAELRTETITTIQPVLNVMTRAKKMGFEVTWVAQYAATGEAMLTSISVKKEF